MTNTFRVKQPLAIDVSYYEPINFSKVDWAKVNPKPAHVIARATYGVRQDTEFANHWRWFREQGIPVAAYHYWYGTSMYAHQSASQGVGDQAENFVRQILANGYTGKERVHIDIEEVGNTNVANGKNFRDLVKQWLDHVERELGQKPGIYSRKDQVERMMIGGKMPEWINDHDIWFAWYPDGPYVDRNEVYPKGNHRLWPTWLKKDLVMWQYSEDGVIDGFVMKDNNRPTTYDFNLMSPGYLESLGVPEQGEPPVDLPTEEKKAIEKLVVYFDGIQKELR